MDLLQGTLDMLVLRTLLAGSLHGYGIAKAIRSTSNEALDIEFGSLYPALKRLEAKGWIASAWETAEHNRRAKYYKLTAAGPKELVPEHPNEACFVMTLAMENVRATWGWTWLESIFADIRYSLRALRKQPAFVAVAVLSLALAIGANSAIFSFADALLLRPLPVKNPAAVFDVGNITPDNPIEGMSFPDYRDLRDKSRSFSGLAAYRITGLAAASNPAAPAQIRFASLVSDNFFA